VHNKIIISDFDGTLARISFSSRSLEKIPFFMYYLGMMILGLLYPFRLPNREIVSFIKKHKGRVIIHSSAKDIFPCRIAIKTWLLIYKVPYDKLILRKHGVSKEHFKYINIVNESGDFVLENEQQTIDYLEERLGQMEVLFQERGCRVMTISKLNLGGENDTQF